MTRVVGWLERHSKKIDWATRIVGLSSFIIAIALYAGQREYIECQARFDEATNARTRILTETAGREREAQRAMEDATRLLFTDPVLAKPAGQRSPAEQQRLQDLFARYQTALTNLDAERIRGDLDRAANPVPPAPSTVCGT